MLPDTLSPQTIEALNDLAYKLRGIFIRMPTQEEVDANQATIERIMSSGARETYAVRVSIAYEYARIHYRDMDNFLLSDIKKDPNIVETIDLSEYKYRLEEDCHCC